MPERYQASRAVLGLPQEKICQLILSERTGKPIDKKTLAEAFRAELDRGMAVTDYAVGNSLVENALSGNVTASLDRNHRSKRQRRG